MPEIDASKSRTLTIHIHRLRYFLFLLGLVFVAFPLLGQRVIKTIPVGINPRWVAVNPVTNKVFVANEGDNSVSVIDGNTFDTSTVPVWTPNFVLVNPQTNKIYVSTDGTLPAIAVIDGSTLTVSSLFTGENIGFGPKPMALNPVTNKIYAVTTRNNLVVIDGATESITEIPVGGDSLPGCVAVNPVTNKVYVTIQGHESVVIVVDGTSNAIIGRLRVGDVADAVEINTVTNRIYVGNLFDDTVSVIDGATDTVLSSIPVQVSYFGAGIAVNEATNQIYVDGYQEYMSQIAGATNRITGQAAVGLAPFLLEVDTASNVLFTNPSGDAVTLINGLTLFTTSVKVGQFPVALAVDAAAKRLYVAVNSNNTLAVIDGHALLSISTIGPGKVWSGDGHINCGSTCSYEYAWGVSNVYLTALPDPGFTLSSLIGCDNVEGNTCTVRVADIQTVTATFSPANVTLSSLVFMSRGVKGGTLFTGTLLLGSAAPSGGVTVSLSSSPLNLVDTPRTLYIPGGRTSMGFAIRTVHVHKPTTVQITATAGASSVTGTLVIQP